MKNERNPTPIDSKRKTSKAKKSAASHSAGRRSATPGGGKKAEARKSSTRNKAAESSHRTGGKTATRSAKAQQDAAETQTQVRTERLPENRHPGLHERSYAAHLDAGPRAPHTKPAGDLRFTAPFPTGRKQP